MKLQLSLCYVSLTDFSGYHMLLPSMTSLVAGVALVAEFQCVVHSCTRQEAAEEI